MGDGDGDRRTSAGHAGRGGRHNWVARWSTTETAYAESDRGDRVAPAVEARVDRVVGVVALAKVKVVVVNEVQLRRRWVQVSARERR